MESNATGRPLPPMAPGDEVPFYYASLFDVEVLYLVDPETVKSHIAQPELELFTFAEGKAAVGFNFQMYTSHFPDSMGRTMEIELYALTVPKGRSVPTIDFRDWVLGMDQSHLIGYYRFFVPCDDPIAIEAGERKFGEPKFKTAFIPSFPSLNGEPTGLWAFTCCDPSYPPPPEGKEPGDREHAIFGLEAQAEGLLPEPSYPETITLYGKVTQAGPDKDKVVGLRWSVLGPWQTYFLDAGEAGRVKLRFGESAHPMQKLMKELIGDTPAAVFRTYASPPASVQPRTYWP